MALLLGEIRLSRVTDASTSPERQQEIITNWANIHDHNIVGWAMDVGVSGAIDPFSRPHLGPWLRGDHGSWDILVGSKIDRLSRRLLHFANLVDWATERGKAVASATEPIDTSDKFGRMIANVLAMFAEFERDMISERNKSSYQLARVSGRWHGGTVPYGYKPAQHDSGKGWVLVQDDLSSVVATGIVESFLGGESLNSICHRLNKAGILPPQDYFRHLQGKPTLGQKWRANSLSRLLGSRSLLGLREEKGQLVYDDNGLPVLRAEPIIRQNTWTEVQERLKEVASTKPRTKKASPLLQIAFCIHCGSPLYRATGGKTHLYYKCSKANHEWLSCPARSIRAEVLEMLVEDLLLSHIGDIEVTEEVRIAEATSEEEMASLMAALDDLLERSAGKSDAVKAVYDRKIQSVEARMSELSAKPSTPARVETRLTGKTYRDEWLSRDVDARRKLLMAAGVRIEAAPASGNAISVGRFERPERYDEAVVMGVRENVQYAFYIPKELIARAAGRQVV